MANINYPTYLLT